MRRAILAMAALMVAAALPAAASADPKPKNKLYFVGSGAFSIGSGAVGKIGAVRAYLPAVPASAGFDDVFGKGLSFGGYIGGPLTDNFSAQIGYTGEFHSSGPVADLEVHWGFVEIKANPRLGRFDPYVLGGIGLAVGNVKSPGAAANFDTGVEFAMTFAGGMDLYVADAVAICPEARVRLVKDSGIWVYPVSLGMNLLFLIE